MPGRSPSEAFEAFIRPLEGAIGCLGQAKITTSPGGRRDAGTDHSWTVNSGTGLSLMGADSAGNGIRLTLRATMRYRIVTGHDAAWRVTTGGYVYAIETAGLELISYHWHPDGRSHVTSPHMHIGAAALTESGVLTPKSHVPTNRISLEGVVRFLIEELLVQPMIEDWSDRLALSDGIFELYRQWGGTGDTSR